METWKRRGSIYHLPECNYRDIIHNATVLQDDFLPQEIVRRDQEMNMLMDALRPAVDGDRPEDAFLVGLSGVGKRCIARACVEKLKEQSFGVVTHHVDCWQHPQPFAALRQVLEGAAPSFDIHRTTPVNEMIERLQALDYPYVVILLDEIDQLESPDLLL